MTDALADIAKGKIKDQAKKNLWKFIKKQLSDNLNDAIDFVIKKSS